MSEVVRTSDKEGPKRQGRVRSRVKFRQGRAKMARWCPKSCELQTRKSQNGKVVSEVVPSSDKEGPKLQSGVRIRANFEQDKAK